MRPLIYSQLVGWYRLLDPARDHADETTSYRSALERAATPPAETLLELGSGAGHNAVHLKQRFHCTLTDISEEMLTLSRELNPECEHHLGDMRTLRLGRTFDTVLVHDAVMYMLTEQDLLAAAETAFVHTRPGGAALFAPDHISDTFEEQTNLLEENDGERALRCIEWSWDPDPSDTTFITEYAFVVREGTHVSAAHDRHVEGLFPKSVWLSLLTSVGFLVEMVERQISEDCCDEVFLCRRP
ncbi:MAG TPA: class I SAM-dependent methyltransferase [Polyangiaceae bacterium]|nr:class I SAM-dependent methyltransferase [Polyangiaceae bacterium]